MPINQLTDKRIQSLKKAGNYPDGGNLYLRVRAKGSKSFILKVTVNKKQREWTIGPYGAAEHHFSLAKARKQRDDMMAKILCGQNPGARACMKLQEDDAKEGAIPDFGSFAMDLVLQIEEGFRCNKDRAQWRSTLQTYCKPIWQKRLDAITTDDVLSILRPVWTKKAETASRLRGRIERVLNAAKVHGFRTGENPAAWHGHLQLLLPKRQKLQRGHHAALPLHRLPDFWKRLTSIETISSAALQFLILTAARSGEIRGATWDEIDLEKRIWVIPAHRMKAAKEHIVPLSKSSVEIIQKMQ
ncbi:tyrosine-type recombinase/integrase [Neorhizobium sp. IRS_2294]|uniref:tyrosine-type recombinase/integrase n=1 Tax=unclassified Neorhizobium TaxID=2629175 RepID=UPI003D2DA4FD